MAKNIDGGMALKKTRGDFIFDALNLALWIVILLLVLYPLWLIVIASVSDPEAVLAGKALLLPVDVSFTGYQAVFQHKDLMRGYANSIFYTVVGSSISVVFTLMAAYGLNCSFPGKKGINLYFVFTMFFTGGLIPQFLMNRTLGLYDTVLLMVIINCVSVWNLMVARTYIQSTVPLEMYEAAVMDGANHFTYFFKVILPLSGTIIAVLSVYYGVARWNDFFTALVYISTRTKLPLQTVLREIVATLTTSASNDALLGAYAGDALAMTEVIRRAEVAKYCCIVVSTVPVVVLYIFMQKYFVKGVMVGSLKG